MASLFQWSESNGAGESITKPITNANFGNVDQANIATVANNPITAGENSFEKWIRGWWSGFTSITNAKFWKSTGAYVTAEDIHAAVDAGYAQPTAANSVVATSSIPTNEGSALSPNSPVADPGYGGYITLQLQTTASSPPGAVNQKTFTLKYDET